MTNFGRLAMLVGLALFLALNPGLKSMAQNSTTTSSAANPQARAHTEEEIRNAKPRMPLIKSPRTKPADDKANSERRPQRSRTRQ